MYVNRQQQGTEDKTKLQNYASSSDTCTVWQT